MKIYLDTIGCRLNQSEIETYARQFRAAGHDIVASPADADLAVVNTCSVTTAAAADSRKTIRGVSRKGDAQVVVTGCWATLEPEQAARLPGVRQIIANIAKDDLVANILNIPAENFDIEPIHREPLPGARLRTRAFIKVQDGCNNRCTFCITTLARGQSRSRAAAPILEDIRAALDGSAQEIVLTGVHMGAWGREFERPQNLKSLIRTILAETNPPRLRLSSLEPWELDEDFFSLWQDRRLARHFHLPLQSGCAATLKRMARKTTPKAFAQLIETARRAIPEVAITTDIIVGFPGETEAEFEQSLKYVAQIQFSGGHVFTYSERPGTAAADLPGVVPHPIRKARNAAMQNVIAQAEQNYRQRFIGQTLPVLWESATQLGPNGWTLTGLTDNYLRVSTQTHQKLWNQITPVVLTGLNPKGLSGNLITNSI